MSEKAHIEFIFQVGMSKCEAKKLMNNTNLSDKKGILLKKINYFFRYIHKK